MLETWDERTARIEADLHTMNAMYEQTERERLEALAKVERMTETLKAIVTAGSRSDQPRAVYCADIARATLKEEWS